MSFDYSPWDLKRAKAEVHGYISLYDKGNHPDELNLRDCVRWYPPDSFARSADGDYAGEGEEVLLIAYDDRVNAPISTALPYAALMPNGRLSWLAPERGFPLPEAFMSDPSYPKLRMKRRLVL